MGKSKLAAAMKYTTNDGCTLTLSQGWPLYEALTMAAIALDDEEIASAIGELQKIQNSRVPLRGNEVAK